MLRPDLAMVLKAVSRLVRRTCQKRVRHNETQALHVCAKIADAVIMVVGGVGETRKLCCELSLFKWSCTYLWIPFYLLRTVNEAA
jgi:hypothetical protein